MINKLSFGLLIFITFFLCSCAGITLTPTPTPQPMGTQDIVFVSDREGNDDLFLINSDGSGLAALTTDPGEDRGPVWSYDGRLIAYWSLRNDNNDIYTISPDGSDEKRLTTDEYRQWSPTWLRDSQHILYTGLSDQIFIMEYDGTYPQVILEQYAGLWNLTTSPDGNFMVCSALTYSESEGSNFEIVFMPADASEIINLSQHKGSDQNPSFSPDGKKILFDSDRDGNSEIYVINIDGTGLTNLTNNQAEDSYPAWSPDGSQIVFQSNRDGNAEIYIMNSNGSNSVNITNNPANDTMPSWKAK